MEKYARCHWCENYDEAEGNCQAGEKPCCCYWLHKFSIEEGM